jgi:photosystem II PsbT protein
MAIRSLWGRTTIRSYFNLGNFLDTLITEAVLGSLNMESVAYILVVAMALSVIFFAIAFREPPRIEK